MTARFVIKKHRRPWGTRFTFTLVAANGEPVATSEPYETKGAALRGTDAFRRAAAEAVVDERDDPQSGG